MLVAQARTEGEQIAQVLNTALGAVQLDEETESRLRIALREALMSLAAEAASSAPPALDGVVVVSDEV